jgi:TonB-linked SusC/RagA family outer membrane protein
VPDGQQLIGTNGKLNPYATLGYNNGKNYFIPDDWYKESFQKGKFRQEYNLSVAGSGEKTNYFFSAGYLDDPGFISNSGIKRITTRLKADYQARKWLNFSTNINYTHSDSAFPRDQDGGSPTSNGSIFYVSNFIAPVYPVYVRDTNGNIMVDNNGLTVYDYGDGKQTGIARPFATMANPIGQLQLDYRMYNMDIISGRWGATADIIEGLRAQASIGLDIDNTDYTEQGNKYYGQWAESGGNIYRQRSKTFAINQQYILTYNRRFGGHNMDILAGYENFSFEESWLDGRKDNIYNPNVYELNNAAISPFTFSGRNSRSLMSFFGRAQYDYQNKYFASLSYRRDASSRFHPDNRWGNFGAVSGAWILSNEDFFNVRNVDLLKVKASWGTQGNDNLPNWYPYMDQYSLTESDGGFSTALSYKGNPDITWETSSTFNAGVEFELFGGRLGGSVEFFNKNTTDLLYNKPVSPSAGYTTIPTNIGNMRNRGVELDLHGTILNLNNFRWDVNANGMYLKNKIISLIGEPIILNTEILVEGGSRYNRYLKVFAGVADEDFAGKDALGNAKTWKAGDALYYQILKDANGNPLPEELTANWATADQRDTGTLIPKFSGGFGTSLSFYGFDVSAQFAYQLGGRVYDDAYAMLMHSGRATGGTNWHKDILGAWTPDNTDSDVPALNAVAQYANSASTRFLISSDYLSLNNITVGYTLPQRIVDKLDIGSVRVYLSGDNLAVFSKRKGLDPRQTLAGVTGSYSYSAMRSFNGGITLNF